MAIGDDFTIDNTTKVIDYVGAAHGAAGAAKIRQEARQHTEIKVGAEEHLTGAALVVGVPAVVVLGRKIATGGSHKAAARHGDGHHQGRHLVTNIHLFPVFIFCNLWQPARAPALQHLFRGIVPTAF